MAGEPVAFQRYVPCRGGRGLSLDAMRRFDRVDGQPLVNGINERLIAEAIDWAAKHGVVDVSLNFAVFRSVLSATDPSTLERGQAWLVKRLDRHFQIESLLRFSAKFQPRWISRYVVYRSVTDIPAVATAALGAEGYLPNSPSLLVRARNPVRSWTSRPLPREGRSTLGQDGAGRERPDRVREHRNLGAVDLTLAALAAQLTRPLDAEVRTVATADVAGAAVGVHGQ